MPGRRKEYYQTQQVDPSKSFTIEDEGRARGYYMGIFGTMIKYFTSFLFVTLLLASQSLEGATTALIGLMAFLYIFGWIATYQAGIKDVPAYGTIWDVLMIGIFFGFVIRIVEGLVSIATFNTFDLDRMSPFENLANSELFANEPIMLGGYTLIIIGLIVAAVAEEMFYRGSMVYGISWMTDKRGWSDGASKVISLLIQAFFFAVLHAAVYQQLHQFFALFAGGIVYGLLFLWKKDLSVCILAHMTLNLSSLVGDLGGYLTENPLLLIVIGFVMIILVYFIVKNQRRKELRTEENEK